MIARLLSAFRAWRIRCLEQDIRWEREHADAYLAGRVQLLARMKREHDRRTSDEIVADVQRRYNRLG